MNRFGTYSINYSLQFNFTGNEARGVCPCVLFVNSHALHGSCTAGAAVSLAVTWSCCRDSRPDTSHGHTNVRYEFAPHAPRCAPETAPPSAMPLFFPFPPRRRPRMPRATPGRNCSPRPHCHTHLLGLMGGTRGGGHSPPSAQHSPPLSQLPLQRPSLAGCSLPVPLARPVRALWGRRLRLRRRRRGARR
jgi:hypothetical protein